MCGGGARFGGSCGSGLCGDGVVVWLTGMVDMMAKCGILNMALDELALGASWKCIPMTW